MPKMRKRILAVLSTLTLAPSLAHATPMPPIVQKYVTTVQGARTLSVDAAQDGTARTLHLVLARPNRLSLTSATGGKITSGLVCDGRTVYEWDQRSFLKRPAPAQLSGLRPTLPALKNDIVFSLVGGALVAPERLKAAPGLQDQGTVSLQGVPARKLSIGGNDDSAAFYFATATGLPLRSSYTAGAKTAAITFSHYHLNQPVVASAFAAKPPPGLTAYAASPAEPALLAVGTLAPDFTLPTADGKTISLSSLKGQVVLLDFWASWCPPCKEALPHTQSLSDEFKDKGVTVLAVNTADTPEGRTAFLKAHPEYTMTMPFDADPQQPVASGKYKVTGIPTFYVIDQDGKVAATFVGYDPDGEMQVKKVLEKLGVK